MQETWNEKDWKLFRSRIADWQEAYIDRLNQEYIRILTGSGNPSDRFWTLYHHIQKDKKSFGVQCQLSRNNMMLIMLSMLRSGVITIEQLDGFSEELIGQMREILERRFD